MKIALGCLVFVAIYGVSFLATAGLFWALCWALATLGVVTITWSWTLSLAVWIVLLFLKAIFAH